MCSKPVGEGASYERGLSAKARLEVTVAVKNKRTGEFESRPLGEAEAHILKGQIETIRHIGMNTGSKAWEAFSKEGTKLTLTKKGIVADGKNILADKTIKGPTKKAVLKTLDTAVSIFGGAEVKFEVRVATSAQVFEEYYNVENEAYIDASSRYEYLTSEEGKALLKYNGYSDEQIIDIQNHLSDLLNTWNDVLDHMEQIKSKLDEGDPRGAIEYFVQYMPYSHGVFCDAMRTWQQDQWSLSKLLGEENPFYIPTNRPNEMQEAAKALCYYADKLIPEEEGKVNFSEALEQIGTLTSSFSNFLKLADFSYKKVDTLEKQETAFNEHVAKAIEAFDDPEFVSFLKSEGWSEKEIETHHEALKYLKEESDYALGVLDITQQFLDSGLIQDGMNYYASEMHARFPYYIDALDKLVIPQKLANGRLPGMGKLSRFTIDIAHAGLHATMLKEVSEKTNSLNVKDVGYKKAIDEASWSEALEMMVDYSTGLKESNTYLKLAGQFNYYQERNLEFTARIGEFVEKYANNRELFEIIMRDHGISTLEAALIFNHYTEAYEAMKDWDSRFQAVVDLVNQKQYTEAIDAYANLINNFYPSFVEKVRNVNFGVKKLNEPNVEAALKEFTSYVGIENSAQLHVDLSTERMPIKPLLDFRECLEVAKEGEIEIPESVEEASRTISSQLEAINKEVPQFQALFLQSPRFAQFFTFGGVISNPQTKTKWLNILKKQGWTGKEVEAFTHLYNQYAALIQPLKEAQHAIMVEKDGNKKRALQSQLKELAKETMPKVQKLHTEFQKRGGFKKLRTIQAAAAKISQEAGDVSALKEELGQLYENQKGSNQNAGFHSVEEMMTGLSSYIASLDPEQRRMLKNSYNKELALISRIQFAEGFVQEAESLVQLMGDRTAYLDNLFGDLGLYERWEDNTVSTALLSGPHLKDPAYGKLLNAHGWSSKDIQSLSSWYDSYMHASLPLAQAKAELDADPENILLQRNFKKVAKQQLPKLSSLSKEFQKNFGSLRRLRELEGVISGYNGRRATLLHEYKQKVATGGLTPEESKMYQSMIGALEISVPMLSGINFSDQIAKADTLAAESSRIISNPMSWDSGFLDVLTSSKSPLFSVKLNGKTVLWKRLLQEHDLSSKDVAEVKKYYQSYQDELHKIMELERKLEINPGNSNVRANLIKELRSKNAKLARLNKKYPDMMEKIAKLQLAISDLNEHLRSTLTSIEGEQEEAKAFPSTSEMYLKAAETTRTEKVGSLSNNEIHSLIDFTGSLRIDKIINKKRAFMIDTDQRFRGFL